VLVFHLEVTGSIPAASIFYFSWINNPCSSFIHHLEPIISKSKSYGMFKDQKKKSQKPIIFVFLALWEPIISYDFFMASTRMFRNFISHNRTHKNPLQTHNFFTLGSHKTIAKFYGDIALV
jgi:hypothetical protein